MPGEWHGVAGSVMPVWHDVHRTRGAAFLADEAARDRRPGQVLGQGGDGEAVSAAGAAPLSPAASVQSPAQILVPLTVPTSLQPIGVCGLDCACDLAAFDGGL